MLRHGCAREPARARDPAQVAAQERHARALDRDVGAGAHGDADARARERGRVVDAVARHRDAPPLALRAARSRRPWPSAGPRRSPSRCRARARPPRRCARLSPVSMTMRSPSASSARSASAACGLIGSTAPSEPSTLSRLPHEDQRLAACAERLGRAFERVELVCRRCRAPRAACGCRARRGRPSSVPTTPRPARDSNAETALNETPRSRAPAMIAAASGCSLPSSSVAATPRSVASSTARAPARRSRAAACPPSACRSCRSTSVSTSRKRSMRLGVPEQHARLRAASDRDHDRHRRREPERARARDDQHGHGVHERVREPRLRPEPRPQREGEQRRGDHRRHEHRRHAIGQALDRRAAALRLGDERDDLREQRVAADALGDEQSVPALVQRSRRSRDRPRASRPASARR